MYWLEQLSRRRLGLLEGDVRVDAAVVGGGIAGLSAAARLADRGLQVAVLEADVCGAGATGLSSGFITPDSELQVADLVRRYGEGLAGDLYGAVRDACDHIRTTALGLNGGCDLIDADCLYTAGGRSSVGTIREEHRARLKLGLGSSLLEGSDVSAAIGTDAYPAAVRYGGTFGINGAAYALGLRESVRERGVLVFEGSPVVSVAPGRVVTARGRVRAEHVLVCVDRFAPGLDLAARDVYRARAYLVLTEPLKPEVMASLFPSGPLMVWDTDLIYQYFRPTAGGRLLVGGGSLPNAYAAGRPSSEPVHRKIVRYIRRVFPALESVRFTHRWEGLIGTTKDVLPLAGPVAGMEGVYLAVAGAGLPWATMAGWIAAECALGEGRTASKGRVLLDPGRAFTTIDPLQPVLGKQVSWMLGNTLAKSFERGGSERVVVRQRVLLTGLAMAAVVGAGWAANRLGGGRRRVK